MVRQLMEADRRHGVGPAHRSPEERQIDRSLGDTIQIGAAELILRTTVPRQFTNGQHPFDYCNVANNWMRTSSNPYQPRILYLMASFINDVAHENKLQSAVLEKEGAGYDFAGRATGRAAARAGRGDHGARLPARDGAGQRLSAIGRGPSRPTRPPSRSRRAGSRTTRTTRRSRSRPSRNTATTRPICATACCSRRRGCWRGWVKMPGERDCFARFEKDWIYN